MVFKRLMVLCCSILFIANFTFSQQPNPGAGYGNNLRAAIVKVDITPDEPQMLAGYPARKSTGILHHIYHKVLLLDDGTTQFFLVSTDLGKMSPSQYDKVADQLKKQFGIERRNFWWSVTHTHSAPEVGPPGLSVIFLPERYKHPIEQKYTSFFEQKLYEGVTEALKKLEPVRLGVGWGFSKANINRRGIDIDGKASLGLNPDGPVDRRIGMIRLDKADGSPLALIANYPLHGTVMGPPNLLISGDAPGVVSEYVEEKIGAPVLFINGAAGNLAPIYSVYPDHKAGHLGQFRVLLGDKILDANKLIKTTKGETFLSTGQIIVESPRKEMGWPEDMARYTRTTKAGQNLIRLPISFLKINDDIAIWSAPLELFCEISNEVRDRSPFPYTFYFGYTNGNLGYLLTQPEWGKGGYEPIVSPFTPVAPYQLTESVVNHLQGELLNPEGERVRR